MYDVDSFVSDIQVIQEYFEEEIRVLEKYGEDALLESPVIDNFTKLIASQFADDAVFLEKVETLIWWFITDNDFGQAQLEYDSEIKQVPTVADLWDVLISM